MSVILPDLLVGIFVDAILKLRSVPENLRLWSMAAWLFNPFTFTIGTRGNCEPLVCAIILWIILCLMNGVSFVSFSFFPFIFSENILLLIECSSIWYKHVSWNSPKQLNCLLDISKGYFDLKHGGSEYGITMSHN